MLLTIRLRFQTTNQRTKDTGAPAHSDMTRQALDTHIEMWLIDRLIPNARNPRRNDAAVDRMAASIQEFGFKIPVLASQ
jgi:hypothetical protein